MLPSLGSCKGSVEDSLGSGHLGGVLKGGGGGQRQERAESLKCFAVSTNSVLVFLCPTSLYMLSVVPENLQSELVNSERPRALYSDRLVWGRVRWGHHTRASHPISGENRSGC